MAFPKPRERSILRPPEKFHVFVSQVQKQPDKSQTPL